MPTEEWLKKHQKVQAYLDPDLYRQLENWMKQKNINQVSQAVIAILEHYLNDTPPSDISSQFLVDEVEELKKEVEFIKASLMEAGAKSLAPKMTTPPVIAPTERVEFDYTQEEAKEGITKSELSKRIGLTIYQAAKAAEEQGLSETEYLFKVTGFQPGDGKRPRYYPADQDE